MTETKKIEIISNLYTFEQEKVSCLMYDAVEFGYFSFNQLYFALKTIAKIDVKLNLNVLINNIIKTSRGHIDVKKTIVFIRKIIKNNT